MKFYFPVFTNQDRIENCDYYPSVELYQILKDKFTPGISVRLH